MRAYVAAYGYINQSIRQITNSDALRSFHIPLSFPCFPCFAFLSPTKRCKIQIHSTNEKQRRPRFQDLDLDLKPTQIKHCRSHFRSKFFFLSSRPLFDSLTMQQRFPNWSMHLHLNLQPLHTLQLLNQRLKSFRKSGLWRIALFISSDHINSLMMTDELLDRSDDRTESLARLESLDAFCEMWEEGEVA